MESKDRLNLIWNPLTVKASIDHGEQYGVQFVSKIDNAVAYLQLIVDGFVIPEVNIVFDLLAEVEVLFEDEFVMVNSNSSGEEDNGRNVSLVSINYHRFVDGNHNHKISFIFLSDDDESKKPEDEIKKLLFILNQYSYIVDKDLGKLSNQPQKPNIIARGIETSGAVIRLGLRATGEVTGKAIISAGKTYTNFMNSKAGGVHEEKDFTQEDMEAAKQRKVAAEWIHSGASTVAGTILYPVRWTGRKAAEISNVNAVNPNADPVRKAVIDTVAGLGNAVSSVTKGITEALGSVGGAIGESAVHYSTTRYGANYTNNVTQHYVTAAGEIGKAGYMGANVITNGATGVILSAVVEGTDMVVNLFEYLVGPVILQGMVSMSQLPFTTPKSYFAVLRPWSISFYDRQDDFVNKPVKILVTSLLDTLPKIRNDDPGIPPDNASNETEKELADGSTSNLPTDPLLPVSTANTARATSRYIELCTVDCSTYLLWPEAEALDEWFSELRLASGRVETISKRRSGAVEIAEQRRAKLMPKQNIVRIIMTTVIVKAAAAVTSAETGRDASNSLNDEDGEDMYCSAASCLIDEEIHGTGTGVTTYPHHHRPLPHPQDAVVTETFNQVAAAAAVQGVGVVAAPPAGAPGTEEGRGGSSGVPVSNEDSSTVDAIIDFQQEEVEEGGGSRPPGAVLEDTGAVGVGEDTKDNVEVRVSPVGATEEVEGKSVIPTSVPVTVPLTHEPTTTTTPPLPLAVPAAAAPTPSRVHTNRTTAPKKKNRLQLLTSAAPSVLPTLQRSAAGVSVWLTDIARVSVLTDVFVEVTPVSIYGNLFTEAMLCSDKVRLHALEDVVSTDLIASWAAMGGMVLEFGKKICVDERTCVSLDFKLKAEAYGSCIVLGAGSLSLADIPTVGEPAKDLSLTLSGGQLGSSSIGLAVSRHDLCSVADRE